MRQALYMTGMSRLLVGQPQGISMFVPTNAAFERMLARRLALRPPPGGGGTNLTTRQQLYANLTALNEVLSYHIVPSQAYDCATLPLGMPLETQLPSAMITPFSFSG